MKKIVYMLMLIPLFVCPQDKKKGLDPALVSKIRDNKGFAIVKNKALEVIKTGFNAGDYYEEVWIRDYNTFIELAAEAHPREVLKEKLMVFFRLQGDDGNIVDGYTPKTRAANSTIGYQYIYTDLEPVYCGHKNNVETDQEASLVQAVYKYIKATGDSTILATKVGSQTVAQRLEWSLEFLLEHRWSEEHGLIWGATTADWGDIQHCHEWGTFITEESKLCVDIYDNAMLLTAIENLMDMVPETTIKWGSIHKSIAENTMKHLWDSDLQKFIPHVYLDGSPFPEDFDENQIYYHGGTAVAIGAGLLSKAQIKLSLDKMVSNMKESGAASIGLSVYPPYPKGFFENENAMAPFIYQNGGDWTWFGARMVQQLVKNGFVEEAYEQILPMVDRVVRDDGFYEWYSIDNEPRGSGTYRGSAGVLYKAIKMLEASI